MPKTPQRTSRPSRETFHVLVEADGQSVFANASAHVGGEWPFRKPQMTCTVRVTDEVVSFSMLRPTKNTLPKLLAKPMTFPRSALDRLDRRAHDVDLKSGEVNLVVEITSRIPEERAEQKPAATTSTGDASGSDLTDLFDTAGGDKETQRPEVAPKRRTRPPTKTDVYLCTLKTDETGVSRITEQGTDTEFELPRVAMNVSVYLPGVRGLTLAVGWIGYFGKSGNRENVSRVAGMVLNAASQLADFRIMSGVEHVQLPAGPAVSAISSAIRVKDVEFGTRVHLFNDAFEPVASGDIGVRIDLMNANPSSGRLLLHYTPSAEIAEAFETYRSVVDSAVVTHLSHELGEAAVAELVYDIVLGSVDDRAAETLSEIGSKIPALQVTPTAFQRHES